MNKLKSEARDSGQSLGVLESHGMVKYWVLEWCLKDLSDDV